MDEFNELNNNLQDQVAVDPLSRDIPQADIYEVENFGNETVNDNLRKLQNELAAKLKERSNYEAHIIAYNKLGTAFYRLLRYDKAEVCFNEQLVLARPLLIAVPFQNPREENKGEIKNALVNLACIYHARKLYELALYTNKQALDICDELEDRHGKARIFNNMANIYEEVLDIESAVECLLKRMDLVTDLADVNGQIKCAASLGSFYQLKGEIRESIMYYEKAIINIRMKIVKRQIDEHEQSQQ